MDSGWRFDVLTSAQFPAALALYRSALGRPFCPWTADYPTAEHLCADLDRGELFGLWDENGTLAGCVALDHSPEAAALPVWRSPAPAAELARLVVAEHCLNRGVARRLLAMLLERLRGEGITSARLLAARGNLPALRVYKALGFHTVGEAALYGEDFLCMEKELKGDRRP